MTLRIALKEHGILGATTPTKDLNYWTKMLKTPFLHVCDLLLSYSYWLEQGEAY